MPTLVTNCAGVIAISAVLLAGHLAVVLAAKHIKVDCHPIPGATKEKCDALGCVWSPVKESQQHKGGEFGPAPRSLTTPSSDPPRVDEPWCYHPNKYVGYKVVSQSNDTLMLQRVRPSFMGKEDIVRVKIWLRTHRSGFRLTIEDADKQRFEPELPRLNLQDGTASASGEFELKLERTNSTGDTLIIHRISTGAVVFSTDLGNLIFTDKFIQLNSKLSSPFVYGLGEHYDPFLKWAGGNQYKVYSFWNTDRLPLPGGTRSYGGFPFLINLDSANQTQAHGIYLHNSNAMDIVLQNDMSITFRPIGGILDFFIFGGPRPLDVTRQFQELVGLPELPARWGLGFHLCRYNYNSLERMKLISKRTRDAGIPYDVQWNDVDALDRANDFSVAQDSYAGLPAWVDELHAQNMHYIPLVDPGISQEPNYHPYQLGTQMDIWIKNASLHTLVGRVWNRSGRTVFPDFSLAASHEFWKRMFVEYQELVKFDGAWIDMNDISNFVDGSLDGCPSDNALEQPPYLPGGYGLQVHSLCLSARHSRGSEYDMHNLYSSYEAIATKAALQAARPGRRSVIISRSSHPGQGAHSGHWSGDVQSTWDYLRWSIPSLLEHSMYGYTMVGSDICGFSGNTTVELCARWSTLGAFYTFSRNHNDDTSIDQDPVALGPEVVAANKNALTKRYSLMPYLYTLVYKAHKMGEPVARSVAFEFFAQNDQQALRVENQFMWGRALMISPVVNENTYEKASYLPEGRWYELDILPESMSFEVSQVKVPKIIDAYFAMVDWHKTSNVSLANMPIFYRGGHIIPVYSQVKATIGDTEHEQPLALEIALCQKGRAMGEIFLDDGDSIQDIVSCVKMRVQDNTLSISLEKDDYKKQVKFGRVKILGLTGELNQVTLHGSGGKQLPFGQRDHLVIFDLSDSPGATRDQPITISWS